MSRCATCASACTPASVRPAPYNSNSRLRVASSTARSISPATVRAFFCICQPLYLVPAYSMTSLKRGISVAIVDWRLKIGEGRAGNRRVLEPDAGQVGDRDLAGRSAAFLQSGDDFAELGVHGARLHDAAVERVPQLPERGALRQSIDHEQIRA